MIDRIVSFALSQRLMVTIAILALSVWGVISFGKLPIDAYPDLSPPHVEIVTQWPGHAAEEVERLITIPIEVEMNGIPKLDALRSISLYGLSSVTMNFDYDADPYFAREQAFERLPNAQLASGVTPVISPLFSPSGLIYRYVIQSPDRAPLELKTIEDWVLERRYRAIQGVADDSGFGGATLQYQVLLDPYRLFARGVSVSQVMQQVAANNANAGGGFYTQGGQFYYVRGLGLVKTTDDIGNIVVAARGGIPIRVRDLGEVVTGYAPRLGEFGYVDQDDAVEGVILMRTGEQAQVVLKKVEQLTKELNERVLPPDVKIVPYYDRQDLLQETTKTVEANLVRGMVLVLLVLGLFLLSARSALIVAVTIPFSLLFAFICLDWRNIPANLLSIGAIDFGIIVDAAVVMVENIFREVAAHADQRSGVVDIIRAAARDVERPIFYAIAVIIAAYLPIYALTGPSGRLFHPMASTMSFALVGSLLFTLTLLPVLCSLFLARNVREPNVRLYERVRNAYGRLLKVCLQRPLATVMVCLGVFAASLLLIPFIGAEFMPHLDEGALWIRATTPYTISWEEAAKLSPKVRAILRSFPQVTTVANELGRPDDGTDPTGFFNNEFYVGLKPYDDPAWHTGSIRTKPQLIEAIDEKLAAFPGVIFNHTQPAEDAVDEAETGLKSSLAVKIFGPDSANARGEGRRGQAGHFGRAGHRARLHRPGARPAEPGHRTQPRRDRAVRPQRRRHQYAHRGGHRRVGGVAGHPRRAAVRPGRADAGAVPPQRGRHPQPARDHARRPEPAAQPVLSGRRRQRGVLHLPRGERAVHRRAVQRRRTRPGRRHRTGPRGGPASRPAARRLPLRLGR